uniref:Uncharacterized protein n=1 Tax=Arundo donax TaxID=35708 RepID=A0A0A8YLM1_ARUDO
MSFSCNSFAKDISRELIQNKHPVP